MMKKKDLILTQYPLTKENLEKYSKAANKDLDQVIISNITAGGYLQIWKYFRRLVAKSVYLVATEPNIQPLLPAYKILSLMARVDKRYIINEELEIEQFRLSSIQNILLEVVPDVMFGIGTIVNDWWRLSLYLKLPRIVMNDDIPKSILYLKTNLWLGVQAGGSVSHTAGVIGAALARKYQLIFASTENLKQKYDNSLFSYFHVPPPSSYVIPREINHYRHNQRFINLVVSGISNNIGFIYQRMSPGNYSGAIISRIKKRPLVLEYNGSEVWLSRNWGIPLTFEKLAQKAEKVCLKHAHLVVTVSDVLRDELIQRGVDPRRVVNQPNGVNTEDFNSSRFSEKEIKALRRLHGIDEDSVVLGFVGTFGHWHGAEVLAKTIQKIFNDDGDWMRRNKLHFVFIGDGVRRKQVEDILNIDGLQPYVTMTGLISFDQIPLYLSAMDIFIAPHIHNPDGSPFFGSPTKIFEYLSVGRPIIASELYQISDIMSGSPRVNELPTSGNEVHENECGILARPGDIGELEIAVKFCVENPEWRVLSGRNSRYRAVSLYSWNRHLDAILTGLNRVLKMDGTQRVPKIKVLINSLHAKKGGGITYLRNILPYLAKDPEIDLHICLHENQKKLLPESIDGVTIHTMNFKSGFWRLALREQIDVPILARKIGANVSFSPANYGPIFAPNSVVLLRNALSVAFVEKRPVKIAYWVLIYLGTMISLLTCRRAIAVSEYAKHSAGGGLLNVLRRRFVVIHHGISEIFSSNKSPIKRENFLLTVSDIYVQKNLVNLLLAIVELKKIHPDIVLKIAGTPVDKYYYNNLLEIISQHNLQDNVIFLGEVDTSFLVDLYRRCCLFVFPSSVETFGNPLIEAMASKAPIACSNTAAMPEVVGDAALFFDPHDVQEMAQVIGHLLSDGPLRKYLGKKAELRSKAFSWHETAQRTIAIFKQVAR